MNAVRSWSLGVDAPPAPPMSADQLLSRAGLVDDLLKALLPAALRGESAPAKGPGGGWWRVTAVWEDSSVTIVAMEVTDAVAADVALRLARDLRDEEGVDSVLRLLGAEVRLAGPGWARDLGGPLVLRLLEQEAVGDAMGEGRVVRSDEGWAAVPLTSEGAPFAVLLGPAGDRSEWATLEAQSAVVAAPLARALGLGSSMLEELSHELRTPLHAILGYVGLLEEELSGRASALVDLGRIRESADTQLTYVEHLLARVRVDEGPSQVAMSEFTVAELLDRVVDTLGESLLARHSELVTQGMAAELETDRDQLQQALVAVVRGRVVAGARLWLGVELRGSMVQFEVRGGRQPSESALSLARILCVRLGGVLDRDGSSTLVVVPRYGP